MTGPEILGAYGSEDMRIAFAAALVALAAFPALAAEPDKPVTKKDVTAGEVAATPVTDLNLRKGEVPPLLVAATQRPYTLSGLGACQQLASAIGELDAVLGEDLDVPQPGERRTTPGRVAQSVVGSFIPFRGLIREVSGASSRDKEIASRDLGRDRPPLVPQGCRRGARLPLSGTLGDARGLCPAHGRA